MPESKTKKEEQLRAAQFEKVVISGRKDRKHFQLQQFSEIGHLHLYKIIPSLLIYLSDKVSQKKSSLQHTHDK